MSETPTPPDDAEQIERTDAEEADVLLADPDDYHRAQRLREIHKARRKVHDIFTDADPYTKTEEHRRQQGQLAHAVTAYIYELKPVLDAAGVDTDLPDPLRWNDLEHYAQTTGMVHDGDSAKRAGYEMSMHVFQVANEAFAEVKPLIEEEENDEWEV